VLLWLSAKRVIDGLWVGFRAAEGAPYPGLQRVEEALSLIKQYSPLHYSRVLRDLERVWVDFVPSGPAGYRSDLITCILDERFVLRDTTTLEQIASAIIHEAIHARLDRWGIGQDGKPPV
jgi:hypothetical protein